MGRGGCQIVKLSLSASAFAPLVPTLCPRSTGGEREEFPVAGRSMSSAPQLVVEVSGPGEQFERRNLPVV